MLFRKGASQNCGVIVAVVANVADVAVVTNISVISLITNISVISLVTFKSLVPDRARGYCFYNLERYHKTNSLVLAWRRTYREPLPKYFIGETRYETYQ